MKETKQKSGKWGVTKTKVWALKQENPNMTATEIAKRLGYTPGVVCQHLRNIRETPEYRTAMAITGQVLPKFALITAIDADRILAKVIDGWPLDTDEVRIVQGALKGGQVYTDKQVTEHEANPRAMLQSFIQEFVRLPNEEQAAIVSEFQVISTDKVSTEPVARPTDPGSVNIDNGPNLGGETPDLPTTEEPSK